MGSYGVIHRRFNVKIETFIIKDKKLYFFYYLHIITFMYQGQEMQICGVFIANMNNSYIQHYSILSIKLDDRIFKAQFIF